MIETFIHVPNFHFDYPVKDNRDKPLYEYDVVLVSAEISKKLQDATEMSIGFTKQFNDKCLQIHRYNSRVLSLLEKWKVEEKQI